MYIFPFCLFVSVYVYASLCDFVCIDLFLPFVLGFCLSDFSLFLVQFLVLVITGGFVFWFGCSLLYFPLSFFIIIFFILIFFYFNNFILFNIFFFLSVFFFPAFPSELCGWQGIGVPAGYQAWASELGEPSSGHRSTRDLLSQHNIKWQPRDLHHNAKTQLHSMTSKLEWCTPYANN